MKTILFFIALTGWTLGLTAHVLSVFDINLAENAPYIWILHVGIFIVWIPTIFIVRKNQGIRSLQFTGLQKGDSPLATFKAFFKNTPTWLTIIAVIGFFYAIINFMLFMTTQGGTTGMENGQYILHNHGQFIRNLTKSEYGHYQSNILRGFSGHWIAFYGLAMAALYPFNQPVTNETQTLPG